MKHRIQFRLTITDTEAANMPFPQKTITTNTSLSRMNPIHKTRDNTMTITTISLYCNRITLMGLIRILLDLVSQTLTLAFNQAQFLVRRPSDDGRL